MVYHLPLYGCGSSRAKRFNFRKLEINYPLVWLNVFFFPISFELVIQIISTEFDCFLGTSEFNNLSHAT